MAVALSTQLENLKRERERLEELLMLDGNWRALRQLETREAAGEPLQAVDGAGLKQGLLRALATNRIFAARAKLLETIELLSSDGPPGVSGAEPASVADRIVMLGASDTFRTKLRMKAAEAVALSAVVPEAAANPHGQLQPRATPEPPERKPKLAKAVAVAATCPRAPDALELIDGLGRRAVEKLQDGGVTRFCDIAAWSSADTGSWRARLDGDAHGSSGWWIEQAAVLATGRLTRFAERARRGDFAALVPAPQQEPPRPAPVVAAVPALAAVVERAVLVQPEPVAERWRDEANALESVRVPLVEVVPAVAAASAITAEDVLRALSAEAPLPSPPPSHPPLVVAVTVEDVAGDAGEVVVVARAAMTPALPSQKAAPSRPATSGYVRPRHRTPEAGEAVVDVPAREGSGRSRSLLRRLKDLGTPDRFEAEGYAAYRGTVEEASVTIIGAADAARRVRKPAPATETSEVATAPTSRFLKALTGSIKR